MRVDDSLKAVSVLRAAGFDPILLKGWSTARLYPDAALRPSGDIDLLVPPARRAEAESLFAEADARLWVDLNHLDAVVSAGSAWEEMFATSRIVHCRDMSLRVLGPEHGVFVTCAHIVRHAGGEALRPLWLCDLAAVVESRPKEFDWDLALGASSRERRWVLNLLALAHHFLGMELEGTPVSESFSLPSWLIRTVERQWERAYLTKPNGGEPLGRLWRDPAALYRGLHLRWPDPLQATIRVHAPLNDLPRLPFRLAGFLLLAGNFVSRGGRSLPDRGKS